MKILKELNRIQKELKAPKNLKNSFAHFNYRSAEGILEAYKKIAGETTLRIIDKMELVGDRVYVKATAILELGEESTKTTAYAREPLEKKGMDEAQVTGATSSYARKYALNGLFCIDDTKDADSEKPPEDDQTIKEMSDIEVNKIVETAKNPNELQGMFSKYVNILTDKQQQIFSKKNNKFNQK